MDALAVVAAALCAVVLSIASVRIGISVVEPAAMDTRSASASHARRQASVADRMVQTRDHPRQVGVTSLSVVTAMAAVVAATAVTLWASAQGDASIGAVLAHGATAGVSVVLIVVDQRWRRLPNPLVLLAAACVIGGLASALIAGASPRRLGGALLVGVVVFAVAVLLYLATRGAIGAGDVKLAGVLGVLVGWWGIDAVFSWSLLSAVLGGALALVAMRRHGRRASVPFGPALLVGAWAAVLLPP